jgi:hypothetical protein
MWTATLIKAKRGFGRLDFEIEYLDDSDGETIRLADSIQNATRKKVRDHARSTVARLDAFKNEVIDLPVGQSIDIDPDAPIPPTPPTPAQIARRAWFDDFRKLQSMLTLMDAVPAMLTPARQTAIDSLRTTLETDWLNSYLEDV